MCRQLYNLVLLKCLQYGDSARALDFWQELLLHSELRLAAVFVLGEETHTGIASCNAVLATCEPALALNC